MLNSISAPVGGVINNRFSCRVSIVLGGALTTFGFATSAFVPSLDWMIVTSGVFVGKVDFPFYILYTNTLIDRSHEGYSLLFLKLPYRAQSYAIYFNPSKYSSLIDIHFSIFEGRKARFLLCSPRWQYTFVLPNAIRLSYRRLADFSKKKTRNKIRKLEIQSLVR